MAKAKEESHERARKQTATPGKYNPNITPLIDVLFLLLLFFILSSKFRQEEGQIPGSLPRVGGSAEVNRPEATPDLPPLQVNVRPSPDSNAAVYEIEGVPRVMNASELYEYLHDRYEKVKATQPDWVCSIKPLTLPPEGGQSVGAMVRWEYVVEVYNQAARAGFKTIGFDQTGG